MSEKCRKCGSDKWSSLTAGVCNVCIEAAEKAIALEQRLILVQASARRWAVYRLHDRPEKVGFKDQRRVCLAADLAFGPADRVECARYIEVGARPLKEELDARLGAAGGPGA